MPGSRARSQIGLLHGSRKFYQNFYRMVISNFLRISNGRLEMLSDSDNYFCIIFGGQILRAGVCLKFYFARLSLVRL